ncbi:uncharacterized protein LOC111024128 [Momordica charantia]|uniref:Uncharacterized protein LOC111024128 n=1 Tax=Momordica charantia TaxID=3673 RepID=A0A6J1DTC3_MOMCH|nr:uncharacterized protein LOC111024128 [Momordica charantia]
MVIDSGSCTNIVSSILVKRLNLETKPHPRPYKLQWLSDCGEYRGLFGSSSGAASRLECFPPVVMDGELVAVPSDDIVGEGEKLWANSLVGQFLDSRPPYAVVSRMVARIWASLEEPVITYLDDGLIVFQFLHASSCDWVLSHGPWHIGGKLLFLRPWTPGIVPQSFSFASVPVWVKLSNIPLELWTPRGLSVIDSVLGVPLCLDKATEDRSRLSFARISVEMRAASSFPSSVKVKVHWQCVSSYSSSGVGRIWVFWRPGRYDFSPITISDQFVHGVGFDRVSQLSVQVLCVYASNFTSEQALLWDSLVSICSAWSGPGVVMGDFNAIRLSSEADLVEPRVSGSWFTWTNKHLGDGLILKRLDHVLVNSAWFGSMPVFEVQVREWGVSDHCPLVFLVGVVVPRCRPSFRFFDYWAFDPLFFSVVRDTWQVHSQVSPLLSFGMNLRALKPVLHRFGHHIDTIQKGVQEARALMLAAQALLLSDPSSIGAQEEERVASRDFWDWTVMEEASLRQKSRVWWLSLGDHNSAFFHRSVRGRIWNDLASLTDDVGRVVTDRAEIARLTVGFYRRLLGSECVGYRDLTARLAAIVDFVWPPECGVELCCPVTSLEVREVLFSMNSGKAPGSDGFSVGFFKAAWSIVGDDFCKAVLHFFDTFYMPSGVNATSLTLILKIPNPSGLGDFRPISCCNVLYKCITKLLANRLKVWLPRFISKNQSAFVPGRRIVDNILLCQELVGGYHLKKGMPRCVPKVDLQKAYDSVHWDSLFGLLLAIGTPVRFVNWIRACVT